MRPRLPLLLAAAALFAQGMATDKILVRYHTTAKLHAACGCALSEPFSQTKTLFPATLRISI